MKCLFCGTENKLKKHLFANNTIHVKCISCGKHVPKTKEALLAANGWVKESEQTEEWDILLGLGKEREENKIGEESFACGNCEKECLKGCICPCHWP